MAKHCNESWVITSCAWQPSKIMLDIPTDKVKEFQTDMLAFFDREHPEIVQEIEVRRVLDDDLTEKDIGMRHRNFRIKVAGSKYGKRERDQREDGFEYSEEIEED
ncbi:MAG: hypothetical protein ACLTLQ_15640 [[Clostridium] scindens]